MSTQGFGVQDAQRLAEELDALDYLNDVLAARLAQVETANDEFIPAWVVERMHAGENPARVWREYRGLSIAEAAAAAGLDVPEIEAIETGASEPGLRVMKRLAHALKVEVDELTPWPQADDDAK
jgi:DNA-binding XRE family transcriptional regulator